MPNAMWGVIGQDRAAALFQRSLEGGSLAHAYLLVGPEHVGKMTLALELARAVNCQATVSPCGECLSCQKIASGKHADVQIIGLGSDGDSAEAKSRAEISIDQIRQVQHASSLPPFEGKLRVFIIDGAERLSTEAANCLLKTLEEPPDRVMFILLTTSDRLLPATVVSRCQRLRLAPLGISVVEAALSSRWRVPPDRARLLARLCRGCLGWAVSAATDASRLQQRAERLEHLMDVGAGDYEERFAYAGELATQFSQSRTPIWEVLDLWLNWWRDLLLVKVGCSDSVTNLDLLPVLVERARGYKLSEVKRAIISIQAAKEQLRLNANPRLALEVLMLNIPREDNQ